MTDTPAEALAEALQAVYAEYPGWPERHWSLNAEALLAHLEAGGWTLAREQDARGGEALRRLVKSRPTTSPLDGRRGTPTYRYCLTCKRAENLARYWRDPEAERQRSRDRYHARRASLEGRE
jgi:hypothetical protein